MVFFVVVVVNFPYPEKDRFAKNWGILPLRGAFTFQLA